MRTIKLSILALAACAAIAVALDGGDAIALSRGPFLEHANAPGEMNCTQCHRTYPLDSGSGRVEILGLPEQYEPSHVYPITVRVSDPGAHEWGFQITSVTDDGSACGFFQTDTLAVQALGPSQKYGRFYAEHTIYGVYAGQLGSAEWHFSWKAPSQDLGPATFYAVGNGANGDHTDFYDYIYSTAITIDGQTRNVRVLLVSPTPGNRIGSGERAEIRWTATNGDVATPASFTIRLSTDGGETYPTVLAANLPGDSRSFVWSVPEALASTSARVQVVGVDSAGVEHIDQSRANLSIEALGLDTTAELALPAGGGARAEAWADIDADGRPDVAIARAVGGPLLLHQTAAGAFEDATVSSGIASIGDARSVAWADVDGDGDVDLAIAAPLRLSIYLNDGQGVFSNVGAPTALPRPPEPRAAVWSDVDADGRPDLLVATDSGVIALRNTTEGFVDATITWAAPSGSVSALAAGPLVAVARTTGLALFRFENGRFVDETAASGVIAGIPDAAALTWADVTSDGILDLVAGSPIGLTVLAGVGGDGARYEDRTSALGLGGVGGATSISVGDFDLDARLDLFVATASGPRVLRNRFPEGFVDVSARFDLGLAVAGAWVDVDGTKGEDLVALAPTTAALLTNPRASSSVLRVEVDAGTTVRVDLDGDGSWTTGAKVARIADGLGAVLVAAPGAAGVTVRTDVPGRGGVAIAATVGGSVAVEAPTSVPTIDAMRVLGTKLVVDGVSLPVVAVLEVADTPLERVKAPTKYRDAGGTSRRLVGRDAALGSLIGGGAVVVRVLDPATGTVSAPFVLR